MKGKAKAYGCGYIFRFDLKLKHIAVWCSDSTGGIGYLFLIGFQFFFRKIKSRNIGEYSNGKKAVPKTVGSTPLKRDM